MAYVEHTPIKEEEHIKITAIVLTVFFSMTLCAPVYAEKVEADFCNPEKIQECKTKVEDLIKSLDDLRSKLVKTQVDLNTVRKLTNEEADRLLKNLEPIQQSIPSPTTEGFMWDN